MIGRHTGYSDNLYRSREGPLEFRRGGLPFLWTILDYALSAAVLISPQNI